MWYYESNNQKQGPVSQDTIIGLFHNGVIDISTRVCEESTQDWKHLSETEFSSQMREPDQKEDSIKKINIKHEKLSTLRSLFRWWVALFIITILIWGVNFFYPIGNNVNFVSWVSNLTSLTFAVLGIILLYKYWQIDQDGYSKTTPGKAVGFLFIPLFNIYWAFIAYGGLAGDQNRFITQNFNDKTRESVRKAHPAIWIVYVLLAIIVFVMIGATGRYFPETRSLITYTIFERILGLALSILFFVMNYDFYQTAKSILINENDHQSGNNEL
jgi:hypothetical protein